MNDKLLGAVERRSEEPRCEHGQRECSICDIRDLRTPTSSDTPHGGRVSTTVVNARTVANAIPSVNYVYIGRPSKWGNPFVIGRDGDRTEVIAKYREWVVRQPVLMDSLKELRGMRLGCYCYPLDCHGDVLAQLADAAEGA